MTDQAPELLPCPFCGGKADFNNDGEMWDQVICGACGCRGCEYPVGREKAAKAWNTRPTPAEPTEEQLREWVQWLDWDTGLSTDDEIKQLRNLLVRIGWTAPAERPSDAAVAWRELECVLNDLMLTVHDCRNLPTFKLRKELRKILEPLYALPPDEPTRVIDKGK